MTRKGPEKSQGPKGGGDCYDCIEKRERRRASNGIREEKKGQYGEIGTEKQTPAGGRDDETSSNINVEGANW